ncbi:MAG: TraR/DksA family transcriptional regulator [Bryobacteraceae bacterium]|nr:TraR/DksA family transcriptional regulator [Bryobacteraceae bacterium]
MTQQEQLKMFRTMLEQRVAELTFATRRRDAIVIEKSADELERRLGAAARELAVRALEGETAKLREARAALRRIHDGSYGTCLECGDEISPKRLKALPAAECCIVCQEARDLGQSELPVAA